MARSRECTLRIWERKRKCVTLTLARDELATLDSLARRAGLCRSRAVAYLVRWAKEAEGDDQ